MVKMNFVSALTATALLHQAYRSIDHALPLAENSWWPYMLDYYKGSRIDALRSFSDYLVELSRSSQNSPSTFIRSQLEGRISAWRLWTKLAAKLSPESICYFATDEIAFTSASMAKLMRALEGEAVSIRDAIVLRDDLLLCLKLFFFRCPALQRVRKAMSIEYFNMPDFLTHYTLDEITAS